MRSLRCYGNWIDYLALVQQAANNIPNGNFGRFLSLTLYWCLFERTCLRLLSLRLLSLPLLSVSLVLVLILVVHVVLTLSALYL